MDPAGQDECLDWIFSTDLMPQLGDIRTPANAIKGSRLEVFEDSSQFLPMESPREFVDLLTSFIKEASIR